MKTRLVQVSVDLVNEKTLLVRGFLHIFISS